MIKNVKIIKSDKRHIPVPEGSTCFNCEKPADSVHHIIPYSYGGRAGIPTCTSCHNLIHHGTEVKYKHSDLIKKGIQKAKEAGKQIGPPKKHNDELIKSYLMLHGMSYSQIAKMANCSPATVCRVAKKYNIKTKDV